MRNQPERYTKEIKNVGEVILPEISDIMNPFKL